MYIVGTPISFVKNHRFLGVTLDRSLTWSEHVKSLRQKLSAFLTMLRYASGTRYNYLCKLAPSSFSINHKEPGGIQAQALRVCLGPVFHKVLKLRPFTKHLYGLHHRSRLCRQLQELGIYKFLFHILSQLPRAWRMWARSVLSTVGGPSSLIGSMRWHEWGSLLILCVV